jgi:hypothetical protein
MTFGFHEKYNFTPNTKRIVKSNKEQNYNYTASIYNKSPDMLL